MGVNQDTHLEISFLQEISVLLPFDEDYCVIKENSIIYPYDKSRDIGISYEPEEY